MLIRKLKLNYFGRFNNKEIELKPGINLIYGENEAGKSTIHTFIKGMFFGIQRQRGRAAATKEDLYTRYLPWDYPGAYTGSMEIEIDGRMYQLQRSFHVNDKSFSMIDLVTGREIRQSDDMLAELIPGFSESTFKNTISIEQLKAQTDSELAAQVNNYIANLSVAGSKEIDIAKAVSFLNEQRKRLEATRNPEALKTLQSAIEDGNAGEEKLERLTLQLCELLEQEKQMQLQKGKLILDLESEAARRMENLPAILEKYRIYQELQQQVVQLDGQIAQLKNKLGENEKQRSIFDQLKVDKKEAEALRNDLYELEKQEQELGLELDIVHKRSNKALFYSIPAAMAIALLMLILSGLHFVGFLLGAASLIIGVTGYIILNQKNRKSMRELQGRKEAIDKKRTDARNGIMDILTRHQVNTIEALTDKQEVLFRSLVAIENTMDQIKEHEERKCSIQDNIDSIYDSVMTYLQYFITTDDLTPEAMQRLTYELRLRKQETLIRQTELNESLETCRLRMEKVRWEISALEGNEEELLNNQLKYEKLSKQEAESGVELEAIKLALSSIGELSAGIHDSFGQQLNNAVSVVIGEVTGHKYNDLKVDEKLDIKVGRNGNYVLLERLSAGTIDQVYFALRLAVADLLMGKDEVPLLFDDSFALYDDTRVKAALMEVSKRSQIILFTCHKREQKLLEELRLPYHRVEL
jgi:uncharacterized protein YhaN